MNKRRVGILGGSFNPVHLGHLMVAAYAQQWGGLDEVWLMLSPANPLKPVPAGASDAQRLEMLSLSCGADSAIRPCDLELSLPRPTYTIHTLRTLRKMYPDTDFTLIIGADNWAIFPRWRQYYDILCEFGVMVYPRPGFEQAYATALCRLDAPVCSLSSTFIRQAIASGHRVNHLVPAGVDEYITHNRLYTDEHPQAQQ